MKIGIDYHLVARNPNSGMGVYVSEIVKKMQKLDKKNEYIIFDGTFLYEKKTEGFLGKILNLLKEQLWIQIVIPFSAGKEDIELFYFPNPPIPLIFSRPIILTIPDMSFIYDESMALLIKIYLFVTYFLSAHKARVITTFSESSKRDIIKILKINPKKVNIVSPALSKSFKRADKKAISNVGKRYKISKEYLLSIAGTFMPRKNAQDLILAFKKLPQHLKKKIQIVFVGDKEDMYFKSFWRLVGRSGLTQQVVCPGYVSERDLVALYSGAKILVSTSLYEGFGLPILQAMACGTPVVSYKNSSLPEVIANAGILVSGRKQLRKAIVKLFSDGDLRGRLTALGKSRARSFSWGTSAQKILEIIARISG